MAISTIAQEHNASSLPAAAASAATAVGKITSGVGATHSSASSATPPSKEAAAIESALRIGGEKRFRTDCGRCHMASHKFPPHVMATAIRHMRVRATLTGEDMRLIIHYMTQ